MQMCAHACVPTRADESTDVHAELTIAATKGTWAGTGPSTHYEQYPTEDAATGASTYDKVFRYRQGVVFTFRTSGRFYVMQWQYVLNAFISGVRALSPMP